MAKRSGLNCLTQTVKFSQNTPDCRYLLLVYRHLIFLVAFQQSKAIAKTVGFGLWTIFVVDVSQGLSLLTWNLFVLAYETGQD